MIKLLVYCLTLFLFLIFNPGLFGQKVLQIETSGKAKTDKIYIGQTLNFQLHDVSCWYLAIAAEVGSLIMSWTLMPPM